MATPMMRMPFYLSQTYFQGSYQVKPISTDENGEIIFCWVSDPMDWMPLLSKDFEHEGASISKYWNLIPEQYCLGVGLFR